MEASMKVQLRESKLTPLWLYPMTIWLKSLWENSTPNKLSWRENWRLPETSCFPRNLHHSSKPKLNCKIFISVLKKFINILCIKNVDVWNLLKNILIFCTKVNLIFWLESVGLSTLINGIMITTNQWTIKILDFSFVMICRKNKHESFYWNSI